MGRALVLNASYEPLCVVTARRAIVLLLDEKAELVHDTGRSYHSEHIAVPVPSVIRLRYYVKVPFRRRSALNRRAVMARDGHRCQYCGNHADSIDHVVPRSRGGAARVGERRRRLPAVQHAERDRLLGETAMELRRSPHAPRELTWVIVAVGRVPEAWEQYLQPASLSA